MTRGQQRHQTTSIKCSAPVRALDVEFTFPGDTSAPCAAIETPPVRSAPLQHVGSSPAPFIATPPLNFLDWFGYQSSTAAAPAAKVESTAAPQETSYVEPAEVLEERKALLRRIEELEKRNKFLESIVKL